MNEYGNKCKECSCDIIDFGDLNPDFTRYHDQRIVLKTISVYVKGFPGGAVVKNPPASAGDAGDAGLIPGSGRSPGKGDGNPLQYSCLQSPTDRGAWQDTVQGVARVRYDLVTKPPPRQHLEKLAEFGKCGKEKIHSGGVLGSGMTMANLGVSERQHCIFKAFEV